MRVLFNLIIAAALLVNVGSAWAVGTYLDFDDFPVTTGTQPGDTDKWAYSSRATNDTGWSESGKSGWLSKTKLADGWNWFFDYDRTGQCNSQYYFDAYSFMDIVPFGHTGNALRYVVTGGRNATCVNLGTPVFNKETYKQSDIYTGVEKVGSMYLYFKKVDSLGSSRDYSGYLQARDANRLTFYIKLPEGWNNTFASPSTIPSWTYYVGNFNMYDGTGLSTGWHHYMNMSHRGGGWARVSVDETTNGDNTRKPGGGNARYIPNFWHNCSQWYIATQPHAGNMTPPFAVLVDNIKWEYDSYAPQNNESVSNIAVMYLEKSKTWEISFNDKYKNDYSYATYEVRYSFDPITNENWAQATPVHTLRDVARKIYERTDGKFQKAHPNNAYVWLPFKLTDADTATLIPGKMVYFAVKDISQNEVIVNGVKTYKTGAQQILTEYPYNTGTDRGGRNFELYPQALFDYDAFAASYPYIKRTYYQIAPNTTPEWPLLSVADPDPNYYVSPTGVDTNDGKSPATAWPISKVNSYSFAPGDMVWFASGDYGTTMLAPKTSGSEGKPITFAAVAGAVTKPILRGGVDMSGRNYIKVDGLDISSSGNAVQISAGSYNVVTNCKLHSSATAWVHAVQLRNGAHYNQITYNTITQASGNNDLINLRNNTDNNLIAYNNITIENSHAAIDLEGYTVDEGVSTVGDRSSNWNIIRGNTITGHNGGGALINLNANSNYNTVDNNILKGDNTVSSYCNLTSQPALHQDMFKLVGMYNIARNNTLSNYPCKDAMGIEMSPYSYGGFTNNSTYQHVYHNVITGVGAGATPLYLFGYNGGEMHDNVIKNNIIYNNGGTYWQPDNTSPLASDSGNLQLRDSHGTSFFTNNLIYKSGYSGSLVWLNDSYLTVAQADSTSANWDGNLSTDPLLDADFLPQAGSPALNGGANLTTITSASGSGNTFTVADAYYFTDGNGVTTGDVIEVNSQHTTITDITYGAGLTGTLTVSPAITWTQGMGVNLPFNGAAPPIGLLGASAGTPPLLSTITNRVNASGRFKVR